MQVADLYLAGRMKPVEPLAAAAAPPASSAAVDPARYAGLFWNPATNLVRRIYAKEGKLFYERGPGNETEMASLGGDRFAMVGVPVQTEVLFSSSSATTREMRVTSAGQPPLVFQSVEPFTPTPADLAAYAGTYFSEELDVTYTLSVEDGRLVSRGRRQYEPVPLAPVFNGAFRRPAGTLLRFSRDGDGRITGFSIGAGRARNLGFTRMN